MTLMELFQNRRAEILASKPNWYDCAPEKLRSLEEAHQELDHLERELLKISDKLDEITAVYQMRD